MRALNTLVSVGLLEIREKVALPEPEPPPMTESPPCAGARALVRAGRAVHARTGSSHVTGDTATVES